MGLFDSIRKKKEEKETAMLEALENEKKSLYENMTEAQAQAAFNKALNKIDGSGYPSFSLYSYCSRGGEDDFSFYLWLKYSPFAPEGVDLSAYCEYAPKLKYHRDFEHSVQANFIFESCLRFGMKRDNNEYLSVNYDGVLNCEFDGGLVDNIWREIKEGNLDPFGDGDWIFDKALYEGDGHENGYIIKKKMNIILSCLDPSFCDKFGLYDCTDPVNQFKRDGKYLPLEEMQELLESWQTKRNTY